MSEQGINPHINCPRCGFAIRFEGSCKRKIRYRKQESAENALKQIVVRNGEEIYKCQYCLGWHIGHKPV